MRSNIALKPELERLPEADVDPSCQGHPDGLCIGVTTSRPKDMTTVAGRIYGLQAIQESATNLLWGRVLVGSACRKFSAEEHINRRPICSATFYCTSLQACSFRTLNAQPKLQGLKLPASL